ncbi:MAG: hypothetical protein PVG39_01395 [Desulfobacteraceae bacterium]|jgi:hypothetical protein
MTVDDLITRLLNLSANNRRKQITIVCPNGLRVSPKIKMVRKDPYDFTLDTDEIVLTWD